MYRSFELKTKGNYIRALEQLQNCMKYMVLCHAKTYLRAYEDSEGPDQTAHPRSLIRAFAFR